MPDEAFDPATGEIIDNNALIAADGGRVPAPAASLADTLRLLDGGQIDADFSVKMRKLIQQMEAHAFGNKGVSKGQVTLTLDLTMANGAITVTPGFKVKEPTIKQMGTVFFATEDGALSRTPIGQRQMFGLRQVGDDRVPTRSV